MTNQIERNDLPREESRIGASALFIRMRDGTRARVVADLDIDGTTLDHERSEKDRYLPDSIGPAIQAVDILKKNGIKVNFSTGRGAEEAAYVRRLTGADGDITCEDGTVALFERKPFSVDEQRSIADLGFQSVSMDEFGAGVIFSKVNGKYLAEFLGEFEVNFLGARHPGERLISSVFSTPEDLMKVIDYEDINAARRGVKRLASHWIALEPSEEEAIGKKIAEFGKVWIPSEYRGREDQWPGIRTFGVPGNPLHILGADSNKGTATRAMHEHPEIFYEDPSDYHQFVIGFGDRHNDLAKAKELMRTDTGIFVLVAHTDPAVGFSVSNADLESVVGRDNLSKVIKTPGKPYGHGILAGIPQVFARMEQIDLGLKGKLVSHVVD